MAVITLLPMIIIGVISLSVPIVGIVYGIMYLVNKNKKEEKNENENK